MAGVKADSNAGKRLTFKLRHFRQTTSTCIQASALLVCMSYPAQAKPAANFYIYVTISDI